MIVFIHVDQASTRLGDYRIKTNTRITMVAQTILFYLWLSSLLKLGPKAAGQGQACNLIVPMRRSDLEE